jgi:hypothetical protein
MVSVAQLVRALACGAGGRGFESHHSPHILNDCWHSAAQGVPPGGAQSARVNASFALRLVKVVWITRTRKSSASACSSMDRASVFGTEGWGFESLRARTNPGR